MAIIILFIITIIVIRLVNNINILVDIDGTIIDNGGDVYVSQLIQRYGENLGLRIYWNTVFARPLHKKRLIILWVLKHIFGFNLGIYTDRAPIMKKRTIWNLGPWAMMFNLDPIFGAGEKHKATINPHSIIIDNTAKAWPQVLFFIHVSTFTGGEAWAQGFMGQVITNTKFRIHDGIKCWVYKSRRTTTTTTTTPITQEVLQHMDHIERGSKKPCSPEERSAAALFSQQQQMIWYLTMMMLLEEQEEEEMEFKSVDVEDYDDLNDHVAYHVTKGPRGRRERGNNKLARNARRLGIVAKRN